MTKTYAVEFTKVFAEDMQAVEEYISSELKAHTAARRTTRAIMDAAQGLTYLPFRNPVVAELPDGRAIRTTRAGNYTIFYLVNDTTVVMLSVVYSRRDLTGRIASLARGFGDGNDATPPLFPQDEGV